MYVGVFRMVESRADAWEVDEYTQGQCVEWHQHLMGRLEREVGGKPE